MQTLRSIRSTRWLLLAVLMFFMPAGSYGQVVGVSISIAPPALPVYVQPICPADNYIWTPGYWAYSDDDADYYFVPGTWAEAPTPGFLWTPGYWGWNNGAYAWNGGYWGSQIGFYGGVNYGFGYGGVGYEGGYWQGGSFFYNRSVSNVNVTVIHNVYSKTVINNYSSTGRASFNGPGGVSAKPTAAQESYAHEQHTPPTAAQTEHQHAAASDRSQFASVNHGKPAVAATAKPGEMKGAGVVPATAAAPYKGATGKEATKAGGAKTADRSPQPASATARTAAPENKTEHTDAGAASEHKSATREPKTATSPAHTTTPKSESAPKAQPEHEAAPKAEPGEAAPKAEPKATPKAQPKREAAPKAEPEREAAPKAEPKATPKAQPKHEAAPKAEPEHEAAPKAEPKATPKAQPPQQHEACLLYTSRCV